jgi:hypothetical protein
MLNPMRELKIVRRKELAVADQKKNSSRGKQTYEQGQLVKANIGQFLKNWVDGVVVGMTEDGKVKVKFPDHIANSYGMPSEQDFYDLDVRPRTA